MKLNRIALKGFRSAVDLDLPLNAPRVLIAGVNGVGKTGIREAIAWALTGRCQYTDGKGAGAEDLIPTGGNRAQIDLEISGLDPLTRSFAEKGGGAFSVKGWTGTAQVQQAALYGKLGTSQTMLESLIDTDTFLRLHHAEAKSLILNMLDVRIVISDPMTFGTEKDTSKSYTLEELDAEYKRVFDERKLAKRQLAEFAVPQAPEPLPFSATSADIQGQLAKLRTTVEEQAKAIGVVAGQRQALALAPPLLDKSSELASASAELAIVMGKTQMILSAAELRRRGAALAAHDPTKGCVIDDIIECPHNALVFKEMSARRMHEAKMAGDVPDERNRLESLVQSLTQHEAKRATESEDRAIALERLAELPDTSEQEAALETLRGRIRNGEAILAQAQGFERATALHAKAVARRAELERQVATLEQAVEVFGPKGARVQALGDAIGKFQDAVNPFVKPFGWELSFSVEPWQAFANGRRVETYSKSEQYRIGIAFQMGLAMLSGLKWAVVDEIDMLDVKTRGIVTAMLMAAPLEQIIILGTREPQQPLPKVDGVLAYRLGKDGDRTVVLESSVAEAVPA